MAFALFNFIKALTLKFSQLMAKNDGIFDVQFHNKNLALKMPMFVKMYICYTQAGLVLQVNLIKSALVRPFVRKKCTYVRSGPSFLQVN